MTGLDGPSWRDVCQGSRLDGPSWRAVTTARHDGSCVAGFSWSGAQGSTWIVYSSSSKRKPSKASALITIMPIQRHS